MTTVDETTAVGEQWDASKYASKHHLLQVVRDAATAFFDLVEAPDHWEMDAIAKVSAAIERVAVLGCPGRFHDPAKAEGSEEARLAAFRRVRDEIRRVFEAYAAGDLVKR